MQNGITFQIRYCSSLYVSTISLSVSLMHFSFLFDYYIDIMLLSNNLGFSLITRFLFVFILFNRCSSLADLMVCLIEDIILIN